MGLFWEMREGGGREEGKRRTFAKEESSSSETALGRSLLVPTITMGNLSVIRY